MPAPTQQQHQSQSNNYNNNSTMTVVGSSQQQQRRGTDRLAAAMEKMEYTTTEALKCCDLLTKRARQLDNLTSPASDASAMLSRANASLAATVLLVKDARVHFDTVRDCEPAIDRLQKGVKEMEEVFKAAMGNRGNNNNNAAVPAAGGGGNKNQSTATQLLLLKHRAGTGGQYVLTEQDIYAAGDSLEIIRDAYRYFTDRQSWQSTASTLNDLERVYKIGTDSMCRLLCLHLKKAGQSVRPKRLANNNNNTNNNNATTTSGKKEMTAAPSDETAHQTRQRLAAALQNRNLLKSIGEFEEYQPVEARPIREIRSIFECLGSHGYQLGDNMSSKKNNGGGGGGSNRPPPREPAGLANIFGISASKVIRTEKVGSGGYTNLVQLPLQTGFPQLDGYGTARREIAFTSFDSYYRRIKVERKKRIERLNNAAAAANNNNNTANGNNNNNNHQDAIDEADAAARDAVRSLEHAMITVAGEKSVYKHIVTPALQQTVDDDDDDDEEDGRQMSPYFSKACAAAYSYVVAAVVDRTLDIIETVFLKEGGIGQAAVKSGDGANPALTVPVAASAAAAGLRMLDGVRMLGPSLAKLCEMQVGDGTTNANSSLSATLCIAIHRTTVKNTARTLENLAKAIQEDPLKGPYHRPKDASVSSVSRDVVRAIRLISPFVSAYKSVSKRRALPWDPNMGDAAGELDSFVRYLVMRLLNSLKGKAINYTKDGRSDGQAKSNLFLMNNAFYLLEELGPSAAQPIIDDAEHYRIQGTWFVDKINKIMDSEKAKYLCTWEQLNTHLTAVANEDLEYQKNDSNVLSHESGRLIKQRFSGFNEDFEVTYGLHLKLCVIDPRLRASLQEDVSNVFLPRYRRFYEKYTKIKFSKKHQSEYTKYSPEGISEMLRVMYVDPVEPS